MVAVTAALDAERAYHPYVFVAAALAVVGYVLLRRSRVAARLWDVRRRPRLATLLVTAVGGVVVAVGIAEERGYWKVAYQPQSLPIARDVQAVTPPSDFVLTQGLDWNPAVLYYARRRGRMLPTWFPSSLVATVVARAEQSDYHTLAVEGNDPGLAGVLGLYPDPGGADLLRHWLWVAVRRAQVYSMGNSPEWVQGAPLIGTADLAAFAQAERRRRLGLGPLVVRCGSGGLALPGSAQPIWLRVSGGAPAGARLTIAPPALAALPVRPVTIVRASAGRWLRCTGARAIAFSQAVEAPFSGLTVVLNRATSTRSTPSTSSVLGPNGVVPSAVAACFRVAGTQVRMKPAGPGTEIYAITQDGAVVGVVKAPDAVSANQMRHAFSAGGYQTKDLPNGVAAFGIYKGNLTSADSILLSKCST